MCESIQINNINQKTCAGFCDLIQHEQGATPNKDYHKVRMVRIHFVPQLRGPSERRSGIHFPSELQ